MRDGQKKDVHFFWHGRKTSGASPDEWRRLDEAVEAGSTAATAPSIAEPKLEISYHIACCNAERRHSAFGYHLLAHYENHLQTASQLCPA